MSIYKTLLDSADDERKFYINLNTKTLKIGRKFYIKEGKIKVDEELIEDTDLCNILDYFGEANIKDNPYKVISILYQEFKHSVPREHWTDKSYFKALDADELTLDELAFNFSRHFAQAMLEGYILLASMKGWLKWENEKNWFWQDKDEKELVILKEWIEGRK